MLSVPWKNENIFTIFYLIEKIVKWMCFWKKYKPFFQDSLKDYEPPHLDVWCQVTTNICATKLIFSEGHAITKKIFFPRQVALPYLVLDFVKMV